MVRNECSGVGKIRSEWIKIVSYKKNKAKRTRKMPVRDSSWFPVFNHQDDIGHLAQ